MTGDTYLASILQDFFKNSISCKFLADTNILRKNLANKKEICKTRAKKLFNFFSFFNLLKNLLVIFRKKFCDLYSIKFLLDRYFAVCSFYYEDDRWSTLQWTKLLKN